MNDVIEFLTFVEDNYYYSSGCWYDRDDDKYHTKEDLYHKYIDSILC